MSTDARRRIPTLIWAALLSVYAGSFLFLIVSGQVRAFLHPRMTAPLVVGAVLSLVMVPVLIASLRHAGGMGGLDRGFLIFLLPILAAGAAYGSGAGLAVSDLKIEALLDPSAQAAASPGKGKPEGFVLPGDGAIADGDLIALYRSVLQTPARYVGSDIEFTAMVFAHPGLSSHRFIAARPVMWCCAADATLVGFLVQTAAPQAFPEQSWVRVRGRIDNERLGALPVLQARQVALTEAPDLPFLFGD